MRSVSCVHEESYGRRAQTLLCSDYTDQLDAVAGCPITSTYVVLMEFYFRSSPTPWIPCKSSRFYRLRNVYTAL